MSSFWKGRCVAVTGHLGFLGSAIHKRLANLGAKAVGVGVTMGEPAKLGLRQNSIDTVFHLGAKVSVTKALENPCRTLDVNVRGSWTVLEACRHISGVLVVASSDKVYGECLSAMEKDPLLGKGPYEVSKACADLLAQSYAYTYGLNVGITRCGNLYGPGDTHLERLIPGTIRSIIRGERPVIRSDSRYGNAVRDYLYIDDAVDAYLLLAQRLATTPELRGEAFNFSQEVPFTAWAVVRWILHKMHSNLMPDIRHEVSREIRQQSLNCSKARRVLGWTPRITFDEGLSRTIAWHKEEADESPGPPDSLPTG